MKEKNMTLDDFLSRIKVGKILIPFFQFYSIFKKCYKKYIIFTPSMDHKKQELLQEKYMVTINCNSHV